MSSQSEKKSNFYVNFWDLNNNDNNIVKYYCYMGHNVRKCTFGHFLSIRKIKLRVIYDVSRVCYTLFDQIISVIL